MKLKIEHESFLATIDDSKLDVVGVELQVTLHPQSTARALVLLECLVTIMANESANEDEAEPPAATPTKLTRGQKQSAFFAEKERLGQCIRCRLKRVEGKALCLSHLRMRQRIMKKARQ